MPVCLSVACSACPPLFSVPLSAPVCCVLLSVHACLPICCLLCTPPLFCVPLSAPVYCVLLSFFLCCVPLSVHACLPICCLLCMPPSILCAPQCPCPLRAPVLPTLIDTSGSRQQGENLQGLFKEKRLIGGGLRGTSRKIARVKKMNRWRWSEVN